MEKKLILMFSVLGVAVLISLCIGGYGLGVTLSSVNPSGDITSLKNSIATLSTNVAAQLDGVNKQTVTFALKSDVSTLKSDVNTLQTDLSGKVLTVLKITGDLNTAVNALKSSPTISQISIGSIIAFCGDINVVTIPKGYLPCDGRACLKSQYPDLSRILGPKFNKPDLKDQTLYFNIPDMRNLFMRGAQDDSERGLVASWKTALPQKSKILVESAGDHTHTTANAGGHAHILGSAGGHTHTYQKPRDQIDAGALAYPANNNDGGFFADVTSWNGDHVHSVSTSGDHAHSVNLGGAHVHALSGGDNETSPANIKVHFIIKYE